MQICAQNQHIVVTGNMDGLLNVWRYGRKQLLREAWLFGHVGAGISALGVSVSQGIVVSGAYDGTLMIWDLGTKQKVKSLEVVENGFVSQICINHRSGAFFVVSTSQASVQYVCLRDVNGEKLSEVCLSEYACLLSGVATARDFYEDGVVLLTGHGDGWVVLWEVDYSHGVVLREKGRVDTKARKGVCALNVNADASSFVFGGVNGEVGVFDVVEE